MRLARFATLRNYAYLRARVHTRPHASARVSPIRIARDGVDHRKTRKPTEDGTEWTTRCRVVIVEAGSLGGLRNIFFSESDPGERVYACVRAGCTHTYATPEARDSCVSIISQKSDNWFVNAFAASATYTTDLLRHFRANPCVACCKGRRERRSRDVYE